MQGLAQAIRLQFDQRAAQYDARTVWLRDAELERAGLTAMGKTAYPRICLDVGSGTGAIAKSARDLGRWILLDTSISISDLLTSNLP